MTDQDYERGLAVRRAVLGDAHVDRALAQRTELDSDFQQLITEMAWGRLWSGDTLSRRERSLLVITLLAALGHDQELAMHLRATRNTGATLADVREALTHVAIYAGVPAANHAFKIARETLLDGSDPQSASHPPNASKDYRSTHLRAPIQDRLAPTGIDLPSFTAALLADLGPIDADLTHNARVDGEPLGERIAVVGRVLDGSGAAVAGALVELWQANSAGRYAHDADGHDAPLDRNFSGVGRAVTDAHGAYRFLTLRPGAYPWANHENAWRPAHLHFSVLGSTPRQRLITQMYFPGDPLLELDPIFLSTPAAARAGLVGVFDLAVTEADFALGYRFDLIVDA